MALNPQRIHIGAGRIFLNVTAPATGDPPTKLAHVDGVPTTGVEVGYTNGPSTFTYKANKQEVEAEQSLNPVAVFITNEECMLEFTAMERTYTTLLTAFDNINSAQTATEDMFWGGDASGLVDVSTQCVALTSRIRTAPDKFETLVIYNVYNVEGVQIAYGRTAVSQYKVTLKALVDYNRVAGDRLFQFVRERASSGVSPSASASPSSSTSASVSASASVSPS